MKRFATVYTSGHTVESNLYCEALNMPMQEDGQRFFLSGKEVSFSDFSAVAYDAAVNAFNKKSETHKRVRVLHGSSVACYVEKWVRK